MFFFDKNRHTLDHTMYLQALTPEMAEALGGDIHEINHLPFRVGRRPRARLTPLGMLFLERHLKSGDQPNQLELADEGPRLHISRRHFRILQGAKGPELEDLGSACGTIVDNTRVGGHGRGGRVPLRHGSVIILGRSASPFILRFMLAEPSIDERAMRQLDDLHAVGVLGEDTYESKVAPLRHRLGR